MLLFPKERILFLWRHLNPSIHLKGKHLEIFKAVVVIAAILALVFIPFLKALDHDRFHIPHWIKWNGVKDINGRSR
jgi:hypothetical protein